MKGENKGFILGLVVGIVVGGFLIWFLFLYVNFGLDLKIGVIDEEELTPKDIKTYFNKSEFLLAYYPTYEEEGFVKIELKNQTQFIYLECSDGKLIIEDNKILCRNFMRGEE